MVSIYDTELTNIKQEYYVTYEEIPVTNSLIVKKNHGTLKRLIPLFDYETVENTTATIFKVLSDKSIITNREFTGNLLFSSRNNNYKEFAPCFNVYALNNIICMLLYDKYSNILVNRNVDVYISTDDIEYTYETTITTDSNGQANYIVTDDEVTSVKFKYKEVFSDGIMG